MIIDIDTLDTLDERQLCAGLVEGIKMALTSDKELFEIIENSADLKEDLPLIVKKALAIKKDVVEKDPREEGLRKVLNFGHTIGHALEASSGYSLSHGLCVAYGIKRIIDLSAGLAVSVAFFVIGAFCAVRRWEIGRSSAYVLSALSGGVALSLLVGTIIFYLHHTNIANISLLYYDHP